MFDVREVDWNQVWKEGRTVSVPHRQDEQSWDERAVSYSKAASETQYADAFIAIMQPRAHWQVLDMACGGGTLAVPLARHVQRVTAVDFSQHMLAILNKRCHEKGIENIKTIQGRWNDDWQELGIGRHDVAIVSRALVADDLRGSILKLDGIARERVYIITTVGDGPYDRRLFEAIGRPLPYRPDYIYPYNLLYQMGIFAEITFINTPMQKTFSQPEEAFDAVSWMFRQLTVNEEKLLRSYLGEHLVCRDGKWSLSYQQMIRWAVIWWKKESTHYGK
jgi:SAM-dependent methyltransferase